MDARPALFFDQRFGDHHPRHETREAHPDNHSRFRALASASEAAGDKFVRPRIPAFERRWAERVHEAAYLDELDALRERTHHRLDADTSISAGSITATETAASALCCAVEASLSGDYTRSFCLARPPGHHARPGSAMGFCLLNHIAIAAAHARACGVERVAIIDWDVHPGNGSAEIFEREAGVFVIDLHQEHHWPGGGALSDTGAGAGRGRTLNLPMPAKSGDLDYAHAFDRVVEPALARFEPQLLLISSGFDAHLDDPLSDLRLSAGGFAALCARVRAYADRWANSRLILSLEGGYAPEALRQSVEACLKVLVATPDQLERPDAASLRPAVQALCERARHQFGLSE